MCMSVLESHLSPEGSIFFAREMSALKYSLSILRLQTKSSCCMEVGGIDGQYGVK